MKDQSYSKTRDNTLRLKNTDDLIKEILEFKNADPKDIVELLTIASCLKYLEHKEANIAHNSNPVFSSNFNNIKH